MEKKINLQLVKEFWTWFSSVHNQFGERFENANLINQLDQWVVRLGDFSWEIGPGVVESNSLIISPNGDSEKLEITKEIVAFAKPCTGWEFRYAKPPKQWDLAFDFRSEKGKDIHVNAKNWEYILLKYPDEMFEIIIKAQELNDLSDSDKIAISEILLDGILGEEKRINLIAGIEVVKKFDSPDINAKSNIQTLADHLAKEIK